MDSHLLFALVILIVAAFTDLKARRIPNRLLISALIAHGLLWILHEPPSLALLESVIFVALFGIAAFTPRLGDLLFTNIGMGDIKLVLYLLLIVSPQLEIFRWLLLLALISALIFVVLMIKRRLWESLPFAPVITVATLLTLV